MVVIDANQDLQEQIGKYTRAETIQLALVHSDNKAADTLPLSHRFTRLPLRP